MVLLAPFLSFVAHHGYPFSAELTVIVSAILAVALGVSITVVWLPVWVELVALSGALGLTLEYFTGGSLKWILVGCFIIVWVLRQHIATILALGFLVFNVVSVATHAPIDQEIERASITADPAQHDNSLPTIIHIIFDGHTGIEGMPRIPRPNAISTLKEDLVRNGFTVFGRAYSQYGFTQDAFATLFNFSSTIDPGEHLIELDDRLRFGPVRLTKNKYLEHLQAEGRRVHIVQTDWVDICASLTRRPDSCQTYSASSISALADKPIPTLEKAEFIVGNFLNGAQRAKWIITRYGSFRQKYEWLQRWLPEWNHHQFWTASVRAFDVLNDLPSKMESLMPGDVLLVHLLLPHGPYALDRSCAIKPEAPRWRWGRNETLTGFHYNTVESRTIRDADYLEQVACLSSELNRLLTSLDSQNHIRDGIWILHGDHGSRIRITHPTTESVGHFTATDLLDTYSTLFAVRKAGSQATYVSQPIKLQEALAEAIGYTRGSFDLEEIVYLDPAGDDKAYVPIPVNFFVDAER